MGVDRGAFVVIICTAITYGARMEWGLEWRGYGYVSEDTYSIGLIVPHSDPCMPPDPVELCERSFGRTVKLNISSVAKVWV